MALEECYALSHRGLAQSRHDFAQRLGADPTVSASADNWTRHRAFDATVRHCVAFDGLPISPDRVLDLLQSAARDGDPRAVARTLLFRDLADSKEGTFDLITRVLSTGDPHTIRDVGLYLTRGESVMFIGDPAIPISATALAIAWELVACDFGLDCSSEGKILNNLCAYEGQCGAHSYEDWLSRHAHSRDELDQILRARLLLRQGLMFHDWQLLGLTGLHPQSRDQTN